MDFDALPHVMGEITYLARMAECGIEFGERPEGWGTYDASGAD